MPFDVRDFPGAPAEDRAVWRNRRLVATWLFVVCGMILIMVVLGGVTRLSGSGLSIMEWAPISGAMPPLSHAEWERLFALYRETPQYHLVNSWFGLSDFQHIFWLEWAHRLWGRLIGLAFILPLLWLWATGRVERRLRPRLLVLFLLGGAQGAVGWFMVESGFFPDSTAVAPIRLAVHLALALVLYAALFWTALGVLYPGRGRSLGGWGLRACFGALAAVLTITIVAGSLVAGTHAGFDFNTFPLMEGQLVPPGYARLQPFARNLLENLAAVQFDHRVLATLSLVLAGAVVALGMRQADRQVRRAAIATGSFLTLQYALGVATLLMVVPVPLAAIHQGNAFLAFAAVLWGLHALRPAPRAFAAVRT